MDNGTLMNGCSLTAGKIGQAFAFDGVNDYVLLPDNYLGQDSFLGYVTDANSSYIVNNDSRGLFIANRTSTTQLKLQKNTSINTFSNNVTSKVNGNFWIGARSINTTAYLFTTRECAFSSIGDGLTDAEATAFYNAVQAYQTTLGRQV